MLIIGHRGAVGLAPENTVSSFKKAEELGVNMVEADLRLNKEGQIVVSHGRFTNKATTLDQVLSSTNLPLNLEIKITGFEQELLTKLKNFTSEVVISSKYPSILKKIRALDGKIKLGLVLGRANFFLLPFLQKLDRGLNLYSVHPKTFLTNSGLISKLRQLNKKVFVWTVNDHKQFERMKRLGVDGVITDRPDIIK